MMKVPTTTHSRDQHQRTITLPLLRKRSEHNEGLVSTLEELALHQEEIQSIGSILGRTCGKTLKILLLQNNVIDRMIPSDFKLLKSLEYLNLALNNIRKIEGLNGMEWLRKLDLTLNFIDVDSLEDSVDELSGCRSLEELFLIGNPCIGFDGCGGISEGSSEVGRASDGSKNGPGASQSEKPSGWSGCRAYIIARLPTLRCIDGKEIKRSERIQALQQLPVLSSELRSLAEQREKEKQTQSDVDVCKLDEDVNETYISDDAPTYHNPETRTKISNELYDQKLAKEKQETAHLAQPPKGEKEWEEEHLDTVQKVRAREEKGREWELENSKKTSSKGHQNDLGDGNGSFKDGGIKQCNQGKYQFWFEDCDSSKGVAGMKERFLLMRIALPKFLSTSLVDVDIHPTYVSVVVKSKILRVLLPVEVISDRSMARRNTATGYLELVMPKVNPGETVIGLCHVRGGTQKDSMEKENVKNHSGTGKNKRDGLGDSILKEANIGALQQSPEKKLALGSSLKFVEHAPDDKGSSSEEDDAPPPIF